jgi:hypothetical protein
VIVDNFVDSMKDMVPFIKMEWKEIKSWAEK